jgi:hypothetical protein
MTESIYSFFVTDDRARWRAIAWSWVCGATVSSFIAVTTNTPIGKLAAISIVISVAAFGGFVKAYTLTYNNIRCVTVPSRCAYLKYTLASLTALLFVGVRRILASPQAVHAASAEVLQAVRDARPVSNSEVAVLRSRTEDLLQSGKVTGTARKQMVYDYAILRTALMYAAARPHKNPIFVVTQEQGGVHERGKVVLNPGELGPVVRDVCPIFFYDIDFLGVTPGSMLIVYSADFEAANIGCSAVFSQSTIKGFTQTLDGIGWIDVVFEQCVLKYAGGSLTLVNVTMKDCAIQIQENVPQSIRDALMNASEPITIASEYPQ